MCFGMARSVLYFLLMLWIRSIRRDLLDVIHQGKSWLRCLVRFLDPMCPYMYFHLSNASHHSLVSRLRNSCPRRCFLTPTRKYRAHASYRWHTGHHTSCTSCCRTHQLASSSIFRDRASARSGISRCNCCRSPTYTDQSLQAFHWRIGRRIHLHLWRSRFHYQIAGSLPILLHICHHCPRRVLRILVLLNLTTGRCRTRRLYLSRLRSRFSLLASIHRHRPLHSSSYIYPFRLLSLSHSYLGMYFRWQIFRSHGHVSYSPATSLRICDQFCIQELHNLLSSGWCHQADLGICNLCTVLFQMCLITGLFHNRTHCWSFHISRSNRFHTRTNSLSREGGSLWPSFLTKFALVSRLRLRVPRKVCSWSVEEWEAADLLHLADFSGLVWLRWSRSFAKSAFVEELDAGMEGLIQAILYQIC